MIHMKKPLKTLALLSGAALLASSNLTAENVSTNPVGYMTLTVKGSPDGDKTAFTPLAMSLEKPVLASGVLSEGPTSVIVTNANASYTFDEFAGADAAGNPTHYLQFTANGLIVDIVSNTATTISVDEDLAGSASAGDAYVVKKYSTIADVFGAANKVGLSAGANSGSSDLVYIMSSEGDGSFSTYYPQDDPTDSFFGGDGWRIVGDNATDQSDVVIGPDDGIIVARDVVGDIDIVVSGSVNVVDHQRGLPGGFSLVSYPYPVDVTLEDSNIYTDLNGYVSGANSGASDLVYVLNSDGLYTTYYRQDDPTDSFFGGDGWRVVGDNATEQGAVVIPAGSSIIIKHRGEGLVWADAKPY